MENALTVIKDEVLEALVGEIEAIVVEKVYEAQSAKIELFWQTGETLRRYEKEQGTPITALISACANDNRLSGKQMGERNLYWAMKIYDHDPDRQILFNDKTTSLTKVKKLLTDGGQEPEVENDPTKIAGRLIGQYGLDFCKKLATLFNNWGAN